MVVTHGTPRALFSIISWGILPAFSPNTPSLKQHRLRPSDLEMNFCIAPPQPSQEMAKAASCSAVPWGPWHSPQVP